ncbi:pyridoxamine 5'-phosphate oxidase family protein [Gordonia sp. CPCC 205333]|uniref:pyridoxamine 5'-phosphate oxidase family protein n=1 Tax=Gordonia sp. CPCC 205333 TaxID=3140790 RepID=UPI003AF3B595
MSGPDSPPASVADFLEGGHIAVLSIPAAVAGEAPLATPLWYSFDREVSEFTVVTPRSSRKMAYLAAGRAVSLCVVGGEANQDFVAIRGKVVVAEPISHAERVAFVRRYRGDDAERFVSESSFDDADMAAVRVRADRWRFRVR